MDGHERDALTDATLDREIDAALDVQPSPEFLARVRARVSAEHVASPWASGRLLAGAGLVAAGVVVLVVVLPWPVREPGPAIPEQAREVRPASVEPVAPGPAVAPTVDASVRHAERPSGTPAAPVRRAARVEERREPEVLISQDEAAALRRLFAAIGQGRVDPSALPSLESGSGPMAPIEELVVDPIAVSPLDRLDSE